MEITLVLFYSSLRISAVEMDLFMCAVQSWNMFVLVQEVFLFIYLFLTVLGKTQKAKPEKQQLCVGGDGIFCITAMVIVKELL